MAGSRLVLALAVAGLTATTLAAAPPPSGGAEPPRAATCSPRAPAETRGLRLVWHDEFSGPRLDRSKWSTVMDFPGRLGGHYHNPTYGSYAVDENVVPRNGILHLITDDEPIVGDDPPGTYDYTEGFVSSHDKFARTYGYWEICARFPAGKGLWPAFWMIPQDRSWPPEFDVAEWFGSIEGLHQGFAYGPDYTDVTWDGRWTYGPDPTTGWHRYGLLWEPGRLVFSIDGRTTKEITGDMVPAKPMYIVLNSGTWAPDDRGGPPDETTVFPNAFEIDWVRVYDAG
ncbi:MAG TPA: glycoside hydrolase family 16 protein [Actinopolymorphaceae bacterium]